MYEDENPMSITTKVVITVVVSLITPFLLAMIVDSTTNGKARKEAKCAEMWSGYNTKVVQDVCTVDVNGNGKYTPSNRVVVGVNQK
jgi:hypothetical protein